MVNYKRWYPNFREDEEKKLRKLMKPGETQREFILRVAGIDSSPIPMGRPKSHTSRRKVKK